MAGPVFRTVVRQTWRGLELSRSENHWSAADKRHGACPWHYFRRSLRAVDIIRQCRGPGVISQRVICPRAKQALVFIHQDICFRFIIMGQDYFQYGCISVAVIVDEPLEISPKAPRVGEREQAKEPIVLIVCIGINKSRIEPERDGEALKRSNRFRWFNQ